MAMTSVLSTARKNGGTEVTPVLSTALKTEARG